MLTINSPKFSASSKGQAISNKMSPSFRNKRVPSALDCYSCQSNSNIPNSKYQSPSKFSEEALRRKSQIGQNNPNIVNCKKGKHKNPGSIIDSIHHLKEQYKALKEAYKQLILQKIKNTEEISKYKVELSKLKTENERFFRENEKLKIQLLCIEQQNERIKRQCYKMLEVEKFKAKKLEQSLEQKEEYINQTLLKIRTEGDESYTHTKKALNQSELFGEIHTVEEQSLTVSQDKSAQLQKDKGMNNQSQFLSFSLTSILQESTYKESSTCQKKQHNKVVSELTLPTHEEEIKITQVKSVKNKDIGLPFKKNKKEVIAKSDLHLELKENKQNQLLNSLSSLVNPRNIFVVEKKGSKSKGTKTFRRKQQEKQNTSELRNNKKKSRKNINLSNQ